MALMRATKPCQNRVQHSYLDLETPYPTTIEGKELDRVMF